jgi:hypothetical protein
MRTSMNLLAAVAALTTASVAFAQQYPSTSASPSDLSTTPPSTSTYRAMPDSSTRAPQSWMNGSMRGSCVGLSDRQTEQACKQGYPVEAQPLPGPMTRDRGGLTDDQAN